MKGDQAVRVQFRAVLSDGDTFEEEVIVPVPVRTTQADLDAVEGLAVLIRTARLIEGLA